MFAGFLKDQRHVNGVDIAYRVGGSGPGLLLLHGHPQTHVIWHKIAEQLAEHFTVVAADLRGYGDSSRPAADDHAQLTPSAKWPGTCVELMQRSGASSSSRSSPTTAALAWPIAWRSTTPLQCNAWRCSTSRRPCRCTAQTNEAFARAYWHWFFLIRPAPLAGNLDGG
jgi:haloacetate dehalogenase